MIRCLHCDAETSNGLALCDLCQRKGWTCLDVMPVYFRNLARQRRPGRPNGSLGTAGQWLIQRGETEPSKVQAALARAMNDLVTWTVLLAEDRGIEVPHHESEPETFAALCELMKDHLTSIATLEWAGQFLRDIDKREREMSALTQEVVPGWYAGECRQVTGRDMEGDVYRCQTPTYVVPGLTWLTCGGCGTTTYARDHLEAVLEEARDWIAKPKAIAEAIVALVDTEQSVPRLYARIRQWADREHITPLRFTARGYALDDEGRIVVVDEEVGLPRYRFGEVIDRVFARDTLSARRSQAS